MLRNKTTSDTADVADFAIAPEVMVTDAGPSYCSSLYRAAMRDIHLSPKAARRVWSTDHA